MPKNRKNGSSMALKLVGIAAIILATMLGTYYFITSRNQAFRNEMRNELRNDLRQNIPQRPARNAVVPRQPVVAPAKVIPGAVVPRTGGTIRRVNRRNHYVE